MVELIIAELRDLYEALGLFLVLYDEHLQKSDDVAKAAQAALDDPRFRALPAMLDFGVIYRRFVRAAVAHERRAQLLGRSKAELRVTLRLDDQAEAHDYWVTLEDQSLAHNAHTNPYAGIWSSLSPPRGYYPRGDEED